MTQARVFRLSHSWSLPTSGTPRALIGQFYGSDALGIRRIWAKGNSEILELPIPEDLIAEGEITRQIGFKLLLPRHYPPIYSTNWRITLEALDSSVTGASLTSVMGEITQTEGDILAEIDRLRDDLF